MIELEQFRTDNGIRFNIKGEKHEVLYIQDWMQYYKQSHNFHLLSNLPEEGYRIITAYVELFEDVNSHLDRIGFAALFKITFSKFEINLPDAATADSELFSKLEQLVDRLAALPKNEATGLDRKTLSVMKEEVGL